MSRTAAMQPSDLVYYLFSTTTNDDPYPVWSRMREEAPLYFNDHFSFTRSLAMRTCSLVCSRRNLPLRSRDDVRAPRHARGVGAELAALQGSAGPHTSACAGEPCVHAAAVAELESARSRLARELLDPYRCGDTFDFVAEFGRQLPMRVIGSLIGVPAQDLDHVQQLFAAFAKMQGDEEGFDFAKLQAINDYFHAMADERVVARDDMMTALVQAEIEGRTLSHQEISEFVVLLDGAGNDTVSLLLGNAALLLAEHADQRAFLADDVTRFLSTAIEEILRFDPPSPVQGRLTARDVESHGCVVPTGAKMLLINGGDSGPT